MSNSCIISFERLLRQVCYNSVTFSTNNDTMSYMTSKEIAETLGIQHEEAKARLIKKGIRPMSYAGPSGALYDPSCIDLIRDEIDSEDDLE